MISKWQDELVTQRESSNEVNRGEAKVDHLTPQYETDGRLARLCTNPQLSEGSRKQPPKAPGAATRTLLCPCGSSFFHSLFSLEFCTSFQDATWTTPQCWDHDRRRAGVREPQKKIYGGPRLCSEASTSGRGWSESYNQCFLQNCWVSSFHLLNDLLLKRREL